MEGQRLTVRTEEQRELVVYLPPSYAVAGERRYPVVYVQDGGKTAADGLNYLEHLFHEGRVPELIIVGIVPHNRNDEYTPWPAAAVSPGGPGFGGGGERYLAEVAERIKPHVDRSYRTLPEPEHTGIAGFSLGGLISLFAYYRRPAVFGRIAALSASFWFEGAVDFVRREPAGGLAAARLYLSVGALEGIYKRNAQRSMVEGTKAAYEALLTNGHPRELLRLEIEPDGTHDAMFAARKLPDALEWLFAAEVDGHAG